MGTKRNSDKEAQKIAKLIGNEQVKQLLNYYGLSLTEPMLSPIFGADQQLNLNIYDEKSELVSQLVYPTLEYLSQDLGFADSAGYEVVKNLDVQNAWLKRRILEDTMRRGKGELARYLQDLRPLLMKRHIYFYTTPLAFVKTEIETGQFQHVVGKRVLAALPMSVQAAERYGYSAERIKELAPQVAWLIPMLVVYRKVKVTDDLLTYLDGWRALLVPQQNEKMYTSFVKHAPHIVSTEVAQLLLPTPK